MHRSKRRMVAYLFVLAMASSPLHAQTAAPSGSDMFVDLVISRPLGLVGVVLGSAAFVVALPFTVPSGSVDRSAEALIRKPARYTFQRPLGEFPDDRR